MSSKNLVEKSPFKFKKTDSIGSADADEDSYFEKCFYDNGSIDIICDTGDSRRIIVGRTGTGKTALIRKIVESKERTILLMPDSLAISYISNSTILRYLQSLGVKLDIFYKMLWRHVFSVEIIKSHFNLHDKQSKDSVLDKIKSMFRNKKHDRVLEYLEKWGQSFWLETDYRVKEITDKLESEIKSSIKTTFPNLNLDLSVGNTISEEQKTEIIHRAQNVVNSVQIQELSKILELIDDVLSDPMHRYYILIDKLDEQWVDDSLKNYLIRALIETIRDFKRVHNAKIIIAIRRDLLDRVYQYTRDSGFQEEKYESLYLDVSWKKHELEAILDLRVNELVQSRYTSKKISYKDLLPPKHQGKKVFDYIIDLTLMRPRDVIMFFNICIQKADGRAQISSDILNETEGEYSRNRLRSLADEWSSDYPNLMHFASMLKNRYQSFALSEIYVNECEEVALDICSDSMINRSDTLLKISEKLINGNISNALFKKELFAILYRTGLIGLKLDSFDSIIWSNNGLRTISSSEINEETKAYVHRCFWRVFGIRERKK